MQQVLKHILLKKQTDLANLKSVVYKLDIDKLKNVPSNLRNVGKLETTSIDIIK